MSNIYIIKDNLGNVVNKIIADEAFVKKHYTNYEVQIPIAAPMPPDVEGRMWRDRMLIESDKEIEQMPDHPQHTKWKEWRKILRDWPATKDFPATLPVRK
jgi:hypothetical protein|tara:strand:+ start:826 stop:1125 length:300 start_codon:yes stop_codon:yes gene_type:complete